MATQLARKTVFEPSVIPDRLYFKIGDVARICSVKTYVLRFWETQFPQLSPNKSGTGQRLYRRRDVETALEIKRLVHEEGFTLSGARQALGNSRRSPEPQGGLFSVAEEAVSEPVNAVATTISHARTELREILNLLTAPDPRPQRRRERLATVPSPGSDLLFPSF
jgi:DNA-binding transcriptional MerR regulator